MVTISTKTMTPQQMYPVPNHTELSRNNCDYLRHPAEKLSFFVSEKHLKSVIALTSPQSTKYELRECTSIRRFKTC